MSTPAVALRGDLIGRSVGSQPAKQNWKKWQRNDDFRQD